MFGGSADQHEDLTYPGCKTMYHVINYGTERDIMKESAINPGC